VWILRIRHRKARSKYDYNFSCGCIPDSTICGTVGIGRHVNKGLCTRSIPGIDLYSIFDRFVFINYIINNDDGFLMGAGYTGVKFGSCSYFYYEGSIAILIGESFILMYNNLS